MSERSIRDARRTRFKRAYRRTKRRHEEEEEEEEGREKERQSLLARDALHKQTGKLHDLRKDLAKWRSLLQGLPGAYPARLHHAKRPRVAVI